MYTKKHMVEWIVATQYTDEFKKDAVRYWEEHPELDIGKYIRNLGTAKVLYQHGENPTMTRKALYKPEDTVIIKVMKQRKLDDSTGKEPLLT